jgi:hypothetical protein
MTFLETVAQLLSKHGYHSSGTFDVENTYRRWALAHNVIPARLPTSLDNLPELLLAKDASEDTEEDDEDTSNAIADNKEDDTFVALDVPLSKGTYAIRVDGQKMLVHTDGNVASFVKQFNKQAKRQNIDLRFGQYKGNYVLTDSESNMLLDVPDTVEFDTDGDETKSVLRVIK